MDKKAAKRLADLKREAAQVRGTYIHPDSDVPDADDIEVFTLGDVEFLLGIITEGGAS